MAKTTKAAQKAVNKYISNNYDRINLTVPKGKKEEYNTTAEAEGFTSLNKFIIYCIEKYIEEKGT